MSILKLLAAPVRTVVRFPLFQFAVVIVIILLLQAADEKSLFGEIFAGIDTGVEASVAALANIFRIKSFTRSWLSTGLWIGYVDIACLLVLVLLRSLIAAIVDVAARTNAFGVRTMVARERGIAAYRAWLPLERIRPAHIPQDTWEADFAWPPDNRPPYRPLAQRIVLGTLFYLVVIGIILVFVQLFTPFPVLTWISAHFESDVRPRL